MTEDDNEEARFDGTGGPDAGAAPAFEYSLFVSYSTDPDYGLVRSLEGALETFHRLPMPTELVLQPLAICVDGSDFHSARATDVEAAIREHLARCERLLVLCSTRAGTSEWVAREIEWFIEARGAEHVWVALTEGVDFETASKGFPEPILKAGLDKRIAYDLRGFRRSGRRAASVRDFDDELTRLAADLYGRSAGDIRPVWFRAQQRRARERIRLLTMFSAALAVFLAAAIYFYVASERERQRAVDEAVRTRRQQYIASVNFARRALDDGAIPAARQFLEAQVPAAGQEDLRDFDWFYLMGRATVLTSRLSGDAITFTTVSVSADGSLMAASGRSRRPALGFERAPPQPVYVWSVPGGTPRLLVGHQGDVHAVRFSPVGSLLVSSDDADIIVWDPQTGREVRRIRRTSFTSGLAFSGDGRSLAASNGAEIVVLDTTTWLETSRLVAYPDQHVFSMAFSPDGTELAGGGLDKVVHVWNVSTRRESATLRGHTAKITSVAWSKTRNVLATGSRDGVVMLWDGGRRKLGELEHSDGAGSLVFSPDGALLAAGLGDPTTLGTRKAIQLWNVASRTSRGSLKGHSGRVDALAFAPDGRTLYSTGEDDAVLVWNAAQASPSSVVERGRRSFGSLAVSPDGRRVAMGDNGGDIRTRDMNGDGAMLTLRAVEDPKDNGASDALGSRISQLSFDDAGRMISLDGRGAVRRWDFGDPPTSRVVFQSDRLLTSVQVAPNGRYIAASHCLQQILLGPWPAAAPMATRRAEGCPTFVEWAPDSRHFVSGGGSPINESPASVFLWDVDSPSPIRELKGLSTWPTAAGFSRDGSRVAAGDWDGHLVIWETATGRIEHAIDAHADLIGAVAYSPAGRVIATASLDKTVRLWDSFTGQERATLEEGNMTFRALAFTPSGRSLIAVGTDDDHGDMGRAVTWSIPESSNAPGRER